MADEQATAKAARPVEKYGDVDHMLKKVRVNGMHSQIEKKLVKSIVSQINIKRHNEEIYKSMLGKIKYQEKTVQLMNKLPGLVTTDKGVAETIDMTKGDEDNNDVEDGNVSD